MGLKIELLPPELTTGNQYKFMSVYYHDYPGRGSAEGSFRNDIMTSQDTTLHSFTQYYFHLLVNIQKLEIGMDDRQIACLKSSSQPS